MTTEKRNYALDFLKIVATALIVFHHYQQNFDTSFTEGINFYFGTFYFGYLVEFFFLLSGYFMLEYGDRIKNGLSFKTFYGKRMLRLLPMVAISTVVANFLLMLYQQLYGAPFLKLFAPSLGALLADCLGVRAGWAFIYYGANSPTWYISVLLLCYLVFYLLNKLSQRWNIPVTYLYVGIVLLGCGIINYEIQLPFLNKNSARGYYAFFAGVLLAGALRNRKITRRLSAAALVALAVFCGYALYDFNTVASDLRFLLTFLVYPALVILCETELAQKIFSAKIWGTLSALSFDVYIWHEPMMLAVHDFMKVSGHYFDFSQRGHMYVFLLLAEIVGAISYYCIEKPINHRLARFFKYSTANPLNSKSPS